MPPVLQDLALRAKAAFYNQRERLRLRVRQSDTWVRILLAVETPLPIYHIWKTGTYKGDGFNPPRGNAQTGQVIVTWGSADTCHDVDRTVENVMANVHPDFKVGEDELGGIFK